MDYKEFVEELVKEIGKETGFRVEFCAADEEETQDCMNVYTNENGKLRLLTEDILQNENRGKRSLRLYRQSNSQLTISENGNLR